ncbi:DUF742 domain-containing protein [Pseudonocardia sp. K10HN5]|uniref:DUF742 domain-containing protein n=2 Tax=Pseudonocardia acidicola TaxID=2724939 RepID=A0ABX1SL07_9PSEU|nr:DUF742 domain-containing protein [Pseudonocardia acidicola]
MNGFSLDSSRGIKRRRWGRRRGEDVELGETGPPGDTAPPPTPAPSSSESPVTPSTSPIDVRTMDPTPVEAASGAAAVRPYAWTRGRTKSGFNLAIETLVSTSPQGRNQLGLLQVEHRAVAELCEQTRSVAEVAALLSLPLGVARVLLGDMAGLGVVTVHQTASSAGNLPDLALMERVLSGLRRL